MKSNLRWLCNFNFSLILVPIELYVKILNNLLTLIQKIRGDFTCPLLITAKCLVLVKEIYGNKINLLYYWRNSNISLLGHSESNWSSCFTARLILFCAFYIHFLSAFYDGCGASHYWTGKGPSCPSFPDRLSCDFLGKVRAGEGVNEERLKVHGFGISIL